MQDGISILKLDRLEAHDRLQHLIKEQSNVIQQGADDCLNKNSLSLAYQGRSPYVYIYGHARTLEDGRTKKIFWEPRLTKPKASSNSFLFRAISKTDMLETCWVLPPIETWNQFVRGNVVADDIIAWSIHQYKTNKKELEKPFKDDLPDHRCKDILLSIAREMEEARQATLAVFPVSS